MDPERIESALREFFAGENRAEGIAAVYLFGSVARGTSRAGSDVDVGVLYANEPPGLERFRLEGDLERHLGGLPVQLVVLNIAPVDLIHRVLRDGKLLLDHDRSRRISFEVRSRNEYWDLLPFLRRYRRLEEPAR